MKEENTILLVLKYPRRSKYVNRRLDNTSDSAINWFVLDIDV